MPNETSHDAQLTSYERLVALAESPSQTSGPRSIFSFEMCIVPPIYFTTTSCRDPVLRRKALGLFADRESAGRAERRADVYDINRGVEWSGKGENGTAVVPGLARIYNAAIEPKFLENPKRLVVTFFRRPLGLGGEWVQWQEGIPAWLTRKQELSRGRLEY
jgi:hypothetical protein